MNALDNLEEFTDPPNYDIEEGERSAARIAFYVDLAKTIGGPILELACGSGLVTIPVAAQGLRGLEETSTRRHESEHYFDLRGEVVHPNGITKPS
jgi:hypothetical protein